MLSGRARSAKDWSADTFARATVLGGAEPVVKVVGGLGGDEIEVEAGWVAVNGERLANSATVAQDSAGRSLRHVEWGKRRGWARMRFGCSDLTIGEVGIPGTSVRFRWDRPRSRPAGADVVTVMAEQGDSPQRARAQGSSPGQSGRPGGARRPRPGAARFPAGGAAEHRARGRRAHVRSSARKSRRWGR